MRKFLRIAVVLAALALVFTGCKKDDKEEPAPPNQIVADGVVYAITDANQGFRGVSYKPSYNQASVYFECGESVWLTLSVFIPAGSEKLVAGTYICDSSPSYTLSGYLHTDDSHDLIGGTLTVSLSGETYTLTLTDGIGLPDVKVSATYTGKLEWFDERD